MMADLLQGGLGGRRSWRVGRRSKVEEREDYIDEDGADEEDDQNDGMC